MKACVVCGPIPLTKRSYNFGENEHLCSKHYDRFRKTGDPHSRATRDPNEIVLYEDYAEIVLYDKNSVEAARTRISLNKVEIARNYKWCSSFRRGKISYVYTSINGQSKKLHQVLFDIPEGMVADHRDTNVLNNLDNNIRFCTKKQNSRNIPARENNNSGVSGVYWNSANENWRARIKVNYESIEIGSFNDLDEAITARLNAEILYFGEYAPQAHKPEFQKYL